MMTALEQFYTAALEVLLAQDGWQLKAITIGELGALGLELEAGLAAEQRQQALLLGQKDDRRLLFLTDSADKRLLAAIASAVERFDAGAFQKLAILIAGSDEKMDLWRSVEASSGWPRGLFCCFEELARLFEKIAPSQYQALSRQLALPTPGSPRPHAGQIATFEAEVVANVPVGGADSQHFKMRFRAAGLRQPSPGQFIMMATRPPQPAPSYRLVAWEELSRSFDIKPQAFLKRPFGIHQAFYPRFQPESFARLSLPAHLAGILHLPFPNQFDIFYKVLPHGVGTHEMLSLQKGDRLQITGPMGKRYDVRPLKEQGVEEVHLIGGGVGMAPLILLAQSLRFHGFKVKAFIGIESWERLKYSDIESSFGEEPRAAHIYLDELQAAGLGREDLFVSCDRAAGAHLNQLIPKDQFRLGVISDLYQHFLRNHPETSLMARPEAMMAFACGPAPMMRAVRQVTADFRIPLQVLMEKRMACGVGVCLSCVCKTVSAGGEEQYQRVCADGPIFDARELKWD